MSFDGIVMAAVATELRNTLVKARVEGVYQPGRLEIVIIGRQPGVSIPLLASCDPSTARVHVSREERRNPLAPPAFCMLLRKRLVGARFSEIRQRGIDRVLEVEFLGPHDEPPKTLVVEVMGRHSNIILVDPASGGVIDSVKHVSPAMSRVREVRPGARYVAPPSQGKMDPLSASEEDFSRELERFSAESPERPCAEFLTATFSGFGRDSARVIASRAGIDPASPCAAVTAAAGRGLREAFFGAVARIRDEDFSFWAGQDPITGEVGWVSVIGPPGEGSKMASGLRMLKFATAADLLDHAYSLREKARALEAASSRVARVVASGIERCRRKLAAQEDEVREGEKAAEFGRVGEIILANVSRISPGQDRARLVDYRDPGLREVEVELDPRLSPQENAGKYFARYTRGKRGLEAAREQLGRTRSDLEYLEQVATTIEIAQDPADIEDILRELEEQGYVRPAGPGRRPGRPRQPAPQPRPLSFLVKGHEVLVGRNNRENDSLTMRIARPDDVWMHAKGIPGAHVVVRVEPDGHLDEDVLLRAAGIAAYYSRGRASSKVPVDYTLRRHVRKPRGARPGMVVYDRERTIMAVPRPPDRG